MPRRSKVNNRKKELKNNSYSRKKAIKNLKLLVLIACEGTETEKNYFNSIFDELKENKKLSPSSFVIAKHEHTDPSGVLDDLLNYKGKLGETYKDFDKKWIVIDRDIERTNGGGHTQTNYNSALQKSQAKGISVAFSNPSFELWLLLHFVYIDQSEDRDSVKRKLSKYMKGYSKSDKFVYNNLKNKLDSAIRNSKKIDVEKSEDILRLANKNPNTHAYRLVEDLREIDNAENKKQ